MVFQVFTLESEQRRILMDKIIKVDKSKVKKYLSPERLDLVIKYMYIEAYITGKNYKYYLELYKRHIALRTGGFEDKKKSINDYVNDFNNLIDSMKIEGFDKNYPIPISSSNNIILNGAHRLSCCLYFKLDMYVKFYDKKGLSWDFDWLVENNFDKDNINILNKYVRLKSENTYIGILWGTIKTRWDDVEKVIGERFKIVGIKDFSFDRYSFVSMIEDIYSYEFGVFPSFNIKNKINFLMKYPLEFRVVIFDIKEPNFICEKNQLICKETVELKTFIREELNNLIDMDKFATIHTTDNPEHNTYISNILLNQFNIDLISKRKNIEYRKEFLQWLDEYLSVLKNHGLSSNDCCIVGSSSLEVMGIRNSTDIDFILKTSLRDNKFPDEFVKLSDNVDIVYKGYHIRSGSNLRYTDDEIIQELDKHFYFRGIKFASVQIIRDRKAYQKRPKDLKDIILIDEFYSMNEDKKFKITFRSYIKKIKMFIQIYMVSYVKHGYLIKLRMAIGSRLTDKQKKMIKKILRI